MSDEGQSPHPGGRNAAGRARPNADAANGRANAMKTFGAVGYVGLSFVFAIGVGVAVGLWLDRVTGWSPLFFIIFFLCGLAAGILNLYRAVSRLSK